jgi:glycosyltransferase involved in cell wall biosynthesis
MKILIVHNHYQQAGGEHTAVGAQIDLLRQHGHLPILYTKDNAIIREYRAYEKAQFFSRAVYSRQTYNEVRQLVERERPDVAHVHNVFPLISPAVYRALKDVDVPIVQTIHNFRLLCPNSLFYTHGQICERCKYGNTLHAVRWRCYRDSYPLSALYAFSIGLHRRWGTFQMIDRFVVLSEFAAGKLVESGLTKRDKITVLGNFLPDPLPMPGSFEARDPYIVFLGRLSTEKGVEILLEAVADLPQLRLKIAGAGPRAEALQTLVRQRGLRHVEFLGHVAGEVKWELLRQALAVVVPSIWYEHFPFVVLESMAAGTAVVASDLGSLPGVVVEGRTGLLFHPADPRHLAEKLMELAADPAKALWMGRTARQDMERNWTSTAHYSRLMSIYEEVVGEFSRV